MTLPAVQCPDPSSTSGALRSGLVVLGCRIGPGYSLLGAVERRVNLAAELYLGGGFDAVIASGGVRWGGILEAEAMALGLRSRGVPAARLFREVTSQNTRENARHSSQLARALGLESLTVVSSSWHLRRAEVLFRSWDWPVETQGAPDAPLPWVKKRMRELREALALQRDLALSRRTSR